jgi:hypothetical protein
MKKTIVLILLVIIGCGTNKANRYESKITTYGCITLTGKAGQSKGGAIIIAESDSLPYFIDRLEEWPDSVYGKRIKVRGEFITIDRRKLFKEVLIQGVAYHQILKKAKWEVVE